MHHPYTKQTKQMTLEINSVKIRINTWSFRDTQSPNSPVSVPPHQPVTIVLGYRESTIEDPSRQYEESDVRLLSTISKFPTDNVTETKCNDGSG